MARIAVIGAGMGAMAAAARLAAAGHRVTVYERSDTYGGALGRFARDGFVFDTGPGLLHLPAVYRDLFVKTGKEPLERRVELVPVDPASRHVLPDGSVVTLPNASRGGVVAALDAAFGAGRGERWAAVLARAGTAWDRVRRPLLEEPLPPGTAPLAQDPYPPERPRTLLRAARQATTLAQVGARELGDARLSALLAGWALEYGLDPRTAPAGATVLPYLEQTFGSWYVLGGMQELARALYERCLERRVTFTFGAEVTAVTEKDGVATGVGLADGSQAEAEWVVAAAAPGVPGLADAAEGEAEAARAPGRFRVMLALRGPRPSGTAHRTVVHAPDAAAEAADVFGGRPAAEPTVTALRPDDPLTGPDDGHEAVTLTATVARQGPVDWRDAGLRERYARVLVERARAAIPDLAERALWQEVRTPADTAEQTGSPGGGVPAPALAGAGGRFLRPSNTTRLRGLLLAGGWAHPGGGLPHAGMSGALVAGLIVEGASFRGSQ